MPDSFPSSGGSGRGRSGRGYHGGRRRPHLPGALKASLVAGAGLGAGSPTMGFALPGGGGQGVGSYSTDGMGSPYGASPVGPYGTSFGLAPMSCTPTQ